MAASRELIEELRRELLPDPAPAEQREAQIYQIKQERLDRQQRELSDIRRQQAIDSVWRRTLEARADVEADYARGCHRGRNDSDDWGRR
jgi:hypothetical protein